MTIAKTFNTQWREESSFGDSPFTGIGIQGYKFGHIREDIQVPVPEGEIMRSDVYSSRDPDELVLAKWKTEAKIPFVLVDGLPFYFALGSGSTGAGPPYTHTLSGLETGNLPSFTTHFENKDGSEELLVDAVGCRATQLLLTAARAEPVKAELGFLYKKIISNDEGTVYDLTNAPIHPPSSNTTPFYWDSQSALTFNDVTIASPMSLSMQITNFLDPVYTQQATAGATVFPEFINTLPRRIASISLVVKQHDRNLWGDFIARTGKVFVVKFQRDTDDYIQITTNAATYLTSHKINQPEVGGDPLFSVTFIPKTVTVEVKDTIQADGTPNFYGG